MIGLRRGISICKKQLKKQDKYEIVLRRDTTNLKVDSGLEFPILLETE